MDEFASAEQALVVARHVTQAIGPDDLRRCTPCREWDVQALADHLVDTIAHLAAAADIETAAPDGDSIDQRIQQLTQPILADWRRRGLIDDVVFSGRTLPAHLALGILSLELVVHGWDFAVALDRPSTSRTPTPLTSLVWRSRPSLRKAAPRPDSIHPCRCPTAPAPSTDSSPSPAATQNR